jgi:hypothetical protein
MYYRACNGLIREPQGRTRAPGINPRRALGRKKTLQHLERLRQKDGFQPARRSGMRDSRRTRRSGANPSACTPCTPGVQGVSPGGFVVVTRGDLIAAYKAAGTSVVPSARGRWQRRQVLVCRLHCMRPALRVRPTTAWLRSGFGKTIPGIEALVTNVWRGPDRFSPP